MPHLVRHTSAALFLAGTLLLGCVGKNEKSLTSAPTVRHLTVMPITHLVPASRDLRVMSFNLRCPTIIDGLNHWSFRKSLLVQTIRKFDPDVLGTQECVTEQATFLKEEFPDYEFVGAGRNDGKASGEMCGVFFKRGKYECVDSGHFWLSETPARAGSKSWGTAFTRMVTWVKLRATRGGDTFCVFNTHFDVWGKRARLESAKLLHRQMSQIAGSTPVIITGDFNDNDRSPTYRTMLAGLNAAGPRLIDTFRVAHPNASSEEGTMHSFAGRRGGPRIDWIFTTAAFQTVAAGIDHSNDGSKYPSDHFPMIAIVRPLADQTARIE